MSVVLESWRFFKIDVLLKYLKLGIQKWRHQEGLAAFEILFLKSLNERQWDLGPQMTC